MTSSPPSSASWERDVCPRLNPREFPGLDSYEGAWYQTALWPHEGVDFTGLRVGVVGTGSSGIQSIPLIAEQAAHLWVFQQTPNFSIPARNVPLDPERVREWKVNYPTLRERGRWSPDGIIYDGEVLTESELSAKEQQRGLETRWRHGGLVMWDAFTDLLTDENTNKLAADYVREKIREKVNQPTVAEALSPTDYPFGAKCLCVDIGYFETFNRDNVTLVDIKHAPIEGITRTGVRVRGQDYELDAIVFATGFDAMTGTLSSVDIRGRAGQRLRQKWLEGPRTYLGLAIAGFPNLFTITGPGSPSVLRNMVVSIEQHVEWISDCLQYLREHGLACIEATLDAEERWVNYVNEIGDQTLFPRADSWYMGANVDGKPRVFMPYLGGVGVYRETCNTVAGNGYEGFTLSQAPESLPLPRTSSVN